MIHRLIFLFLSICKKLRLLNRSWKRLKNHMCFIRLLFLLVLSFSPLWNFRIFTEGTKMRRNALSALVSKRGVGDLLPVIRFGIRSRLNFIYSDSVWCLSVCIWKIFCGRFKFWAPGFFQFSLSRHEGTEKEQRIKEHIILPREPIVYRDYLIRSVFLLYSLIPRRNWTFFG